MKNPTILRCLLIIQVLFFFSSCSTEIDEFNNSENLKAYNFTVNSEGNYEEGFEAATKNDYAGGLVSFPDGDWYFTDALLGSLSSDAKTGNQSVRLQRNGLITMSFDLPEGAKSFSISYAKFGNDKQSSFQVYYSTDSGGSWNPLGNEITARKSSLETTSFSLNVSGNIRFEIRKTDGKSNRLNIDDIIVAPNPTVVTNPGTGELTTIIEDYDTGSKGSYAAGTVELPTGVWYLENALLGTLDGDRKNGVKSVRIRDLGTLEMNFDVLGAESITFSHAVYGTDGASTWQLEASINQGSSWEPVSGIESSSATNLETLVFNVNYTENVRFRIVKLSGIGDRLNIDDFVVGGTQVTETGGGDPGSGGTDPISGAVHLTMGNPSQAVTNISFPNNYLLEKEEYVMSYSRDKGTANWVSWHLDEAWFGEAARQNDFRSDTTLPATWYQVGSTDYQGSGFDRGHLCPSADRTLSVDDNSNTFFMTNMMPQAPSNNRYAWANLENYCRSMLSGGYEIYIISGGYGIGGDGANGYAETLANGKIQVPSNTWKVIMIIPDGTDDVNRVTTSTRVIAVDMPNSNSVSSDWTQYRTTVDDIEAATGYDFFSLVPDAIENVIEANIDSI